MTPDDQKLLLDIMSEYGGGGHSIFSPSGSAMWLYCSGSLIANLLEDDDGSYEAAEGTVAHELAEQWLRSGVKPTHRIGEEVWIHERPGKPVYEVMIDEVMLDWVEEYVNWCICLPGKHYVESRVYFTQLMPQANPGDESSPVPFVPQGGTADHAACSPGRLVISDFKYGAGVFVNVEGNTQGVMYALGFFYEWDWLYDFQEITIRIGQPRMFNFSEWTLSREELLRYAEDIREGAKRAWQVDAPRRVGEKACRWCKAKYDCAAYAVAIEALASADIEVLTDEADAETMSMMKSKLKERYKLRTADTSSLSIDEMSAMLDYQKVVASYFDAIRNKLTSEAKDGVYVPGKKLAAGRSSRDWKNPGKAAEHLEFLGIARSDIYRTEVVTPAVAEDLLRKQVKIGRKSLPSVLGEYVYSQPGRPTLVDDKDPRPSFERIDDDVWDD